MLNSQIYLFTGAIDFNDTKMSKSEGNLLLIRDLLKEIPGEVVRMALISTHYRKPINWSNDLIKDSKKKLDRLYGAIRKIDIFQCRLDHSGLGSRDQSEFFGQEVLGGLRFREPPPARIHQPLGS